MSLVWPDHERKHSLLGGEWVLDQTNHAVADDSNFAYSENETHHSMESQKSDVCSVPQKFQEHKEGSFTSVIWNQTRTNIYMYCTAVSSKGWLPGRSCVGDGRGGGRGTCPHFSEKVKNAPPGVRECHLVDVPPLLRSLLLALLDTNREL